MLFYMQLIIVKKRIGKEGVIWVTYLLYLNEFILITGECILCVFFYGKKGFFTFYSGFLDKLSIMLKNRASISSVTL